METSIGFIILACITGLALIGAVVSPIVSLFAWLFTRDDDKALMWLPITLVCCNVCLAGCATIGVLSILNS
nr:MAG TPA: hypothetical protein [Bacteriophage sp.]